MRTTLFPFSLLVFIVLGFNTVYAQNINSAGNKSSNSTSTVLWSLGGLSTTNGANISTGLISEIIVSQKTITNIKKAFTLDLSFYPNPTPNSIYIKNNGDQKSISYRITDTIGKTQFSIQSQKREVELDLSNLPVGLYILIVGNQNQSKSYKIIKQ